MTKLTYSKYGFTLKTQVINETDEVLECTVSMPSTNSFDLTPEIYEIVVDKNGIRGIIQEDDGYTLISVKPWLKGKLKHQLRYDAWNTIVK